MKKPIKILIISLLVLAVLGALCYTLIPKFLNANAVATVGKQKITEDEYKYFLANTKSTIEQNANVQSDQDKQTLWKSKIGNQSAEEYAKDQTLSTCVEFKILLDKAKEGKYSLTQTELTQSNSQIDSTVKSLASNDDGSKEYEKAYGVTPANGKIIAANVALIQKYYAAEVKKIQVTDAELKKFYDENKSTYQKVTVKHVLFLTMDQSTQQPLAQDKQDAAKKNADDILARVKAGEDIGTLAKQYSEDTGSKDNGGEYTFGKGEMVKEFEDWSFSAKVGDVGIVKTSYGYHVIRLEKILGFDDVKDTVKTNATSKKFTDKIAQWKKDSNYTLKKNDTVLSKIKIL